MGKLSADSFDYLLPNVANDIITRIENKKALEGLSNEDRITVSERKQKGYSPLRGMLAPKNFKDLKEVVYFQFNPDNLQDNKSVDWGNISATGFNSNDYYWLKGGERSVTFNLFFDATAGSNNKSFGNSANYGDPSYDTLDSIYPKGVLTVVEKLTSFLYPQIFEDNAVYSTAIDGKFQNGVVIPSQRFLPPPVLIFSYGQLYMECILASAPITYTLFNENLVPIRAEAAVTLKVIESTIVTINNQLLGTGNFKKYSFEE